MAFRSPSDGALISPYQQSFGSPGQTKVSGDRHRETTHKIYCYESQLIFYLETFARLPCPVIMYFLKPSLPSWKTSRHCTVLLHTRREAERAEQGKHPDESYLKGTFPLLHKQVIEESSMCSSLIVCHRVSHGLLRIVQEFCEQFG